MAAFAFQSLGVLHPHREFGRGKERSVAEQGLQLAEALKEGKRNFHSSISLVERVTVILGNAFISPESFETVIESPFCSRVKIQSPLQRKVCSSIVIFFPFLLFLFFFFQCKMLLMNIRGVLTQHRTEPVQCYLKGIF